MYICTVSHVGSDFFFDLLAKQDFKLLVHIMFKWFNESSSPQAATWKDMRQDIDHFIKFVGFLVTMFTHFHHKIN